MTALDLLHRIELRRGLPAPGERRALREAAGLSVSEVARALGISRHTLYRWESGEHNPSLANLEQYIETLRLLKTVQGGGP